MTWYTYGTVPVFDPDTDRVIENATGGKFRLTPNGADQPMRDINGTTITSITSNGSGQSAIFQAESLYGVVQFGTVAVTVWANEVADKLNTVDAALAAAQAAANAANSTLAQVQALIASGSSNGLPTGTTLDAIPNGADRFAVTGAQVTKINNTPTAFLQLAGTGTATTAMRSDRTFAPSEIGAVRALGVTGARIWFGRTTTQGPPTEAEGAVRTTDYAFLDVV